jgi:NAD(P)H dehydrogenase (quinone)
MILHIICRNTFLNKCLYFCAKISLKGEGMKILILFFSTYGHTFRMVQTIAEGVLEIPEIQVDTISPEILTQIGALDAQKKFDHIAIAKPEDLANYGGIIVGTPTRYGNMAGKMRNFWDQTEPLWIKGVLVGKVGGVSTSSATQHGGQETTILSTMMTLLHHGMIIAGLPYAFKGQMRIDEITGCSPYGISTVAGGDGLRQPSQNELEGAR